MSHTDPRPPAADGEREDSRAWLIETLQSHIYADATGLAPAVIGHHLFGFEQAADAILSRLTAAEAGREELKSQARTQAMEQLASDAGWELENDNLRAERNAALARVEKLEKALEAVVRLLEDGGDVRPGGPTHAKALDALWNRAALTEAQPKGDQ